MKEPTIWSLNQLIKSASENSTCINGKWVPARPIGYCPWPMKLRAVWLVLTGKADLVRWPEGQ